jgi:hypothetical protein
MTNDPLQEYQDRIERARRLLPTWFVPRMMDDEWFFGLLLVTGRTLRITHIDDVHRAADGSLWIDASMEDPPDNFSKREEGHLYAPTSRLTVSVNAAHIVAAFELADT